MPPPKSDERPVKHRCGARVLVVAGNEVLLVRDTDPGVPGSQWWVLPGGGVDDGETARQAAMRELAEETGLIVGDLIGPIAERVVTHGYSDRVLIQREQFFRVDTPRFEPRPAALSASEKQRAVSCEWVLMPRLASLRVWPCGIADLLEASPEHPIEWGEVEESTVPCSSGRQRETADHECPDQTCESGDEVASGWIIGRP